MRAAIYDPYLDSLGGGERYVMTFAKTLQEAGWSIDIEWNDEEILQELTKRFGIDTKEYRVVPSINRGEGYDLCFWLSDGSVPTLFARNNILHFQRPFYDTDGKSLINRMKFFRINEVVVNSKFTKEWIDREYPQKSVVLYPPVDTKNFKPGRKENIILAVGRFSQLEQSKRQDVLVDVFKKMYDVEGSHLRSKKWKLVLAGGTDIGRTEFVDKLKENTKIYPITILESPPFSELKRLYSKAKIFWTASGYGIDESKMPQKVEHFGITTVEAMSAGAIPLAIDAGGHRESVNEGNGYLWKKKSELARKTLDLINDAKLMKKMSLQGQCDAKKYSEEEFKLQVLNLVK